MAHRTVHRLACLVILLAVTSSAKKEQTRWSRQISASSYTSDMGDWVPLSGPVEKEPPQKPQVKRQAVAEPRILTEPFPGLSRPTGFNQDVFPSRNYYNAPANRQLYLQSVPSVPSAPQNFLNDQGFGQSLRFGLSQSNFPLNQGFVAPPFGFDSIQPQKPRTQPIINPVSFSQILPGSPPAKPFLTQGQKPKMDIPRLVDGYRAENVSSDFGFNSVKKPQSLQKIKFDSFDNPLKSETSAHNSKLEKEEVQLLYVPLESLNRGQFNLRSPLTTSQLVNMELYSQGAPRPNPMKQTFISDYQRPGSKPLDNFSGQNYFSDFSTQLKDIDQVPKYSTIPTPFPTQPSTTPKPKKLKPHQPPLAIFMTKEVSKNSQVKVGDVLSSLKNADTIAVLDSVNPLNAPKVFIGPSTLPPPENFVKFELPYLSNIENSDKKLKQLPFFVAPLSYNTPNGFAKIPFPSPHVGSVVINSQIRESGQASARPQSSHNPNYYAVTPPAYKPEKPVTQKPTFSYYSTTAPKVNPAPNYQSNYYSFEPQTVSSVKPPKQPETATAPPKKGSGSYFISNVGPQYNSQEYTNFSPQNSFKSAELIDQYNFQRQSEHTTTLRTTTTTTTTTTKPPTTYPSQLLETHNPYSINQAFHFSTPLDYNNYFDDVKQPYVTPSTVGHSTQPPTPSPYPSPTSASPPNPEPQPEQLITEKPKYRQQSSPNYLQNYTPEIHYDSDQNLKYPVFNPTDYIAKTELTSQQNQPSSPGNTDINTPTRNYNTDINSPLNNNYNTDITAPTRNAYTQDQANTQDAYKTEYNQNVETQPPVEQETPSDFNDLATVSDIETPPKYENNEYNAYQTNFESAEINPTSSSTTSTTTTRRTPQRHRGRPRYTTTPRSESYESTTRVVVTRRPLRERKPLPTRPRYEPNKITTEKPSRKPFESSESTTKTSRVRTRGRIHYRPSENEDIYDKRTKTHNGKEEDLAYQRDILHQNYPVTLMERASTVDIEAITEPTPKLSSGKIQDPLTETTDTENAYTNEKATISQHYTNNDSKEDSPLPTFTARSTLQTETSYLPNVPSTHQEYFYQSRSSTAPVESSAYDETSAKGEDIYVKHTTPVSKPEYADINSDATETAANPVTEQSVSYSVSNEFATVRQDESTTGPETENTKIASHEHQEIEEEENIVQTTPSYNRVRVRPGVIRQYHQASTESSRAKERRRPAQPVTYRPAFDRRRTTMRIDEIEADLKTKQVHARPEVQEIRHPVYRPESTTEFSASSPSTTEGTTKRGHFRRRKPSYSYTTTSTESPSTKRIYEVKNRFRGRRPTDKPTETPDVQTEAPTSTTRSSLHSRYSHRPRLSERYNHNNKKTEVEDAQDQDSNYSINRPKYAQPNSDSWSPKISSDSFKPYNPNDIIDEQKVATTERRTDIESDLDIITAKNEYEDILLTVTPASNNRINKKIPEIPPTLEALVEQSKVTKSESTDAMSTFESMLEEVMKSLEEQDQDEYTMNVMKHKGGEIGEIPPERIISSGDNYVQKSTTPVEEITTEETTADDSTLISEDDNDRKARRRGFWKKVKVRPVTTESIDFAESQYYTHTVNRLGQPLKQSKNIHEKSENIEKPKVTTYKPSYSFIKDLFSSDDEATNIDVIPTVDIPKLSSKASEKEETLITEESKQTTVYLEKETQTETAISPGDLDLGTGSPDPTIDDLYLTTPTEPTTTSKTVTVNRSDGGFSFMDYLFGVTSEDNKQVESEKETKTSEAEIQITTEQPKPKIVTTESAFIPDEITAASISYDNTEATEFADIKKLNGTEKNQNDKPDETTEISVVKVESSSVSSYMNPANVVSTSMSTEVSHETEICFRGKCIKTSKDIL